MSAGRILVVDDEPEMAEACRAILVATKAEVEVETDASSALHRLCSEVFDVVVADIRMPGMDGLQLARSVCASCPGPSFIFMTAFPSADSAEDSARLGVDGYVTKPFTADQILATVTRALMRRRLRSRPVESPHAETFEGMIAASRAMHEVFALIRQLAPAEIDVLVLGESGTGKELIARAIHHCSARSSRRFVPVDCGAIPEPLLESQLFGHHKGAFTGATSDAIGLVEFAHGGTLFLDEVCELAPMLQAKLLRTLQERQIRRIGGTDLIAVDIRVIAATNRDIDAEVKAGRFREDLFHRLNAIRVEVPPLRQRMDDIAPLFDHFLERTAREAGKSPLRADVQTHEALRKHAWPGNVRELLNVARRAAVVRLGETVTIKDLPPVVAQGPADGPATSGFFLQRSLRNREFERDYLFDLLLRHKGDIQAAVREAEVPRATLYRWMKRYGLKPAQFRA
ncbi:MAG: sigma-54-dependent Fis family transcriptional regulator [Planctomycetes bacterium]|nr:sigma-54-dependent Fis family transcriptional regulator [Planctomycetota bacterium]